MMKWSLSEGRGHLQELGCKFGEDGAWAIALDLFYFD